MEYWVSHIKREYNHISEAKAFLSTIEGLKNPIKYSREEIIKSIDEKNDKWYTCLLKDKDTGVRYWERVSEINIVEIDDKKYIRTDENKKKSDNLGELPPINEI